MLAVCPQKVERVLWLQTHHFFDKSIDSCGYGKRNQRPLGETVVKAFRPPDAIKYSHAKPQEISLERRID
jgi:hypothetical protein